MQRVRSRCHGPLLGGALLAAALLGATVGGCQDEGEPLVGQQSPCDTPQGPLLGCPPPTVGEIPPTIELSCQRLVGCNVIFVDNQDENGNHRDDYAACVDALRGDQFTADRLDFSLRCIEVSTCLDLRGGLEGPCFVFGGNP